MLWQYLLLLPLTSIVKELKCKWCTHLRLCGVVIQISNCEMMCLIQCVHAYGDFRVFYLHKWSFLNIANFWMNTLEWSVTDNVMFSDHVPINARLGINPDHNVMFERHYSHKLAWHQVSIKFIKLCLVTLSAQTNLNDSACNAFKWYMKHPVSKQNWLAIMLERSEFTAIPFDV